MIADRKNAPEDARGNSVSFMTRRIVRLATTGLVAGGLGVASLTSGTAAAQAGRVTGNAASRPAGAAIAPAKQRQVRSILIKMGVIAGAGVALGTVTALTKASGPKPPGAK